MAVFQPMFPRMEFGQAEQPRMIGQMNPPTYPSYEAYQQATQPARTQAINNLQQAIPRGGFPQQTSQPDFSRIALGWAGQTSQPSPDQQPQPLTGTMAPQTYQPESAQPTYSPLQTIDPVESAYFQRFGTRLKDKKKKDALEKILLQRLGVNPLLSKRLSNRGYGGII